MKEEQFLYFPKINGSKNKDENLIHDKDCKFRGLGKWVFDFKEIGKVTVGASFSIPNEYRHLTFCLNSNIRHLA